MLERRIYDFRAVGAKPTNSYNNENSSSSKLYEKQKGYLSWLSNHIYPMGNSGNRKEVIDYASISSSKFYGRNNSRNYLNEQREEESGKYRFNTRLRSNEEDGEYHYSYMRPFGSSDSLVIGGNGSSLLEQFVASSVISKAA